MEAGKVFGQDWYLHTGNGMWRTRERANYRDVLTQLWSVRATPRMVKRAHYAGIFQESLGANDPGTSAHQGEQEHDGEGSEIAQRRVVRGPACMPQACTRKLVFPDKAQHRGCLARAVVLLLRCELPVAVLTTCASRNLHCVSWHTPSHK